jgi:glycolate oxidase
VSLPADLIRALRAALGSAAVVDDPGRLSAYGQDALERPGHTPDLAVLPGTTADVSAVARLCSAARVPMVPRGGGTGYTGGSVPVRGGVVISMERFTRILEIDTANLLAVVEPNVVTGDLQDAVERVGLFYPPDPASLRESVIGGNVAESAGGPRAFKYGTTRHYVLGLEAVLPSGEVVRTGGKTVKNVAGYDLTQLLVGSEGTLAIITRIVLRLVPRPTSWRTLRATFASVGAAAAAVSGIVQARVVPATLELIDGESLRAAARHLGTDTLAAHGTEALLLLEVDGVGDGVAGEALRVADACRAAGAIEVLAATTDAEREALWQVRRALSHALKVVAPFKINHDVVVPKGRIPQLCAAIEDLRRELRLRVPCFGHAGDGNLHVNFMVDPDDADEMARAREGERRLFDAVVALEGAITGEHGVGFTKAPFMRLAFSEAELALMRRVKAAFDPLGLLNPGKIFP